MDWKPFEPQIESLPERRRAPARRLVERLVEREGMDPEAAILEALRRFGPATRQDAPKHPRALVSPEVSLAEPHGPEGESHGGRPGGDPLRFVEDSTPAGANAYSRTRGSPAESKQRFGKGRARIARVVPPAERTTKPRLRTPAARGAKGAVRRIPGRVKSKRTKPLRSPPKRPGHARSRGPPARRFEKKPRAPMD